MLSRAGGASVAIRFDGTGVAISRLVGSGQGKFAAYLDGKLLGTVSSWSSTTGYSAGGSTWTGLADRPHLLVLRVLGLPGNQSVPTSLNVNLDRVSVLI